MAQIEILITNFVTTPYNVYVCDVYGNQCVLVANVNIGQPPTLELTIPSQFNYAPAIGIKIVDFLGCEIFKIYDCGEGVITTTTTIIPETYKQFQDEEYFYFMDNIIYEFQS